MEASPSIKLFLDTPVSARKGIRLIGRYGQEVRAMLSEINIREFTPIQDSINLWAEIRWAAKNEAVVHLEDLLLRRVRLSTLLPDGGISVMSRIKQIAIEELDWNEQRWEEELEEYKTLLEKCYSLNL
jgi:glycerol-3-phosphate dehydrogenase